MLDTWLLLLGRHRPSNPTGRDNRLYQLWTILKPGWIWCLNLSQSYWSYCSAVLIGQENHLHRLQMVIIVLHAHQKRDLFASGFILYLPKFLACFWFSSWFAWTELAHLSTARKNSLEQTAWHCMEIKSYSDYRSRTFFINSPFLFYWLWADSRISIGRVLSKYQIIGKPSDCNTRLHPE